MDPFLKGHGDSRYVKGPRRIDSFHSLPRRDTRVEGREQTTARPKEDPTRGASYFRGLSQNGEPPEKGGVHLHSL